MLFTTKQANTDGKQTARIDGCNDVVPFQKGSIKMDAHGGISGFNLSSRKPEVCGQWDQWLTSCDGCTHHFSPDQQTVEGFQSFLRGEKPKINSISVSSLSSMKDIYERALSFFNETLSALKRVITIGTGKFHCID